MPHLNIIAHMKQTGNPLNRVALGVDRLKFLIEWNVPEMALLLSTRILNKGESLECIATELTFVQKTPRLYLNKRKRNRFY